MNQKKDEHAPKTRNRSLSTEKAKTQLSRDKEDFNTGSHSPSPLLNVGAGYDDTGMGTDSQAQDSIDKKRTAHKTSRKENQANKNIPKAL